MTDLAVSPTRRIRRTVLKINQSGGKAIAIQGHVSKAAEAKRVFADMAKAFGQLDVLVNNAGVFGSSP